MTVPIGGMTATFANSSIRYDAIAMNAQTAGQLANSTLINLKANGNTRFSVDIFGNTNVAANLTSSNLNVIYKISSNSINVNSITANGANITTGSIAIANITAATIAMANVNAISAQQANATTMGVGALFVTSLSIGGSPSGSGQHTIWCPAISMIPNSTNGPTANTWETGTNDVMVSTLDFDPSTQQSAQFSIQMPKSWDEGTIVTQYVWSHPSTTTNFGVVWDIASTAYADGDALDSAFPTAVSVVDTGGTTNDVYISPEAPAMTVGGTPGAEELVVFRVRRAPANGSDTMAVTAQLHGIKLHYTTNASNDS